MFRMFLAILFALAFTGCRQDPQGGSSARAGARPGQVIAQLHWLGKSALSSNTNAAYLLSIWNLPETAQFEKFVVDKLATIPLQLVALHTNLPATNPAVAAWRPFLQDLVYNETFLDLRRTKTATLEGGIAVRLTPSRAAYWQTNLPSAFANLPGAAPLPSKSNTWRLASQSGTYHAHLSFQNHWALLRFGPDPNPAKYFDALALRQTPLVPQGTNPWLHARADLAGLAKILGLPTTALTLPRVTLSASSEGEYIRTTGKLSFQKPLNLNLEPWTIPTNIIRNPLISFTAVRGFRPWLKSLDLPFLRDTNYVPNQGFLWSLQGGTMFHYAILPWPNANQFMTNTAPAILDQWEASVTNHSRGRLIYDPKETSLTWNVLPIFTPSFLSVTSNIGEALLARAGFMTPPPTTQPFPPELLSIVTKDPATVYYDWEITEQRLGDLFLLGQLTRLGLGKTQISRHAPAIPFLMTAGRKLGNAVTTVKLNDRRELSLERKSHSGFTALEWHLLADWLESPIFPQGLFTTATPPQPRSALRPTSAATTTNSPAQAR